MTPQSPPRIRAEILIVLGLSLGQSAVYSITKIIQRYMSATPVGSQTTTLNPSLSSINVMDLVYQVLRIGFSLVPVALALFLLSGGGIRARDRLGLLWARRGPASPWRDVAMGAGLAGVIGIPGIGLYVVGRHFGQTVKITTSGLPDHWWSASILILAALAAGILEEVVAVGYLMARLTDLRWHVVAVVAASALLRGSYHLYQGYPMAIGNVVMGVVFALVYLRTRRLGPLIVAHAILDMFSFLGPEYLPHAWLVALRLA